MYFTSPNKVANIRFGGHILQSAEEDDSENCL